MPSISVAPIYTDAWAKTIYEGQARIVYPLPNSPDVTLLGVTCRLYWVRFFFTEINLPRWVEISAIVSWTDQERIECALAGATPEAYLSNRATELLVTTPVGTATDFYAQIPLPPISSDFTLLEFQCRIGFGSIPNAGTLIDLTLYRMTSGTPGTAASAVYTVQSTSLTTTYHVVSKSIPAGYTFIDAYQYGLEIHWHLIPIGAATLSGYAKAFYLYRSRIA
jgi:hypothetical protein